MEEQIMNNDKKLPRKFPEEFLGRYSCLVCRGSVSSGAAEIAIERVVDIQSVVLYLNIL